MRQRKAIYEAFIDGAYLKYKIVNTIKFHFILCLDKLSC